MIAFKKYIGKKCEAIVAFGDGNIEGGAQPLHIVGILEYCDDNYIHLKVVPSKKNVKADMSVISTKALLVLNVL